MDDSADRRWRYHLARDQLLTEVHARPSTALAAPMLATRIATLSGEDGAAIDCQHMVALCRRLGQSQPSASSKWCVLDAGSWKLRWHDTLNFRPGRFFGRQREVIRSLKPAWTWFRLSGCDVTPNLHPVPIRASASLLPTWAGEARGCVAYLPAAVE